MKHELIIRFTDEAAVSGELTHQVRNFAEDLQRVLSGTSIGTVENVDTAVQAVRVHVQSKRMVGEAMSLARTELKRHRLFTRAVIEH